MANAVKYLANVTKSIKYASVDAFKQMNPVVTSFIETNEDVLKTAYTSIKDFKATANKATTAVTNSYAMGIASEAKKNLFDDLKTGKFYNRERIEKATEDAVDDLFADDDEDWELSLSSDSSSLSDDISDAFDDSDEFLANTIDSVGEKSSTAVSRIVAKSADYQVEASKEIFAKTVAHQHAMFGTVHADLSALNTNVANLLKFSSESVVTHIKNSTTFYDTQTKLMQDQNAMIKELLDLTKQRYETPEKNKSDKLTLSDIMDSEGAIDIANYAKYIKQGISNNGGGGISDTVKMMKEFGMFEQFAASPLGMVLPLVVTAATPKVLKGAMKEFNDTLGSLFSNILIKTTKLQGNWDNDILQQIGNIFGIQDGFKTYIDTSKYNKDAVRWNGKSEKALTEVIPTLLSKIYSAVSGGPDYRYDYKAGRFKTTERIREEFNQITRQSTMSSAGELYYDLMGLKRTNLKFKSQEQESSFEKDLMKVLEYNMKHLDTFNKKSDRRSAKDYGISEANLRAIEFIWDKLPKTTKIKYSRTLLSARASHNSTMTNIEEDGSNVFHTLFNGIDNSTTVNAANNKPVKMSRKYESPIEYLFLINKNVEYIRKYGLSNPDRNYIPGQIVGPNNKPIYPSFDAFIESSSENISSKPEKEESIEIIESNYSIGKRGGNEQQSFLDKLTGAKTLTDKFKVIFSGVNDLVQSPAKFLAGTLHKADERIYDLLFGDDGREGSVMNTLTSRLNKWFDDSIEAVKGKLDEWKEKATKENIKNAISKFLGAFGIDTDKIKNSLFGDNGIFSGFKDGMKDSFKSVGEYIKNSFLDAKDWLGIGLNKEGRAKRAATREYNKQAKSYNSTLSDIFDGIRSSINDIGPEEMNAAGSRYIKRTGLAIVSKGERIIPPDRDENKIKQRYRNEQRVLNDIRKRVGLGNIALFAEGTDNDDVDNAKFEEWAGKGIQFIKDKIINLQKSKPDECKKFINYLIKTGKITKERLLRILDSVEAFSKKEYKKFKAEDSDYNVEGGMGKSALAAIKKAATEGAASGFVNDIKDAVGDVTDELKKSTKDDPKFKNAIKDIASGAKNYLPKVATGGILGAGISLITGAIGGPLLGAAVGSAISLIKSSNKVQEWLFGELDENGDRQGGLISKELSDNIQKYVPGIAKGATVGLITSILPFVPGGPVAGLIVGGAAGFVSKSESAQRAIFGTDENFKNFQKSVRNKLPKMGLGALTGLVLGPFGVTTNILLGAALGFASDTNAFKDVVFGKEDFNGERHGGIAGVISASIKPIRTFVSTELENLKNWAVKDVLTPVTSAIAPIGNQIKLMIDSIGDHIKRGIDKVALHPIGQFIQDKVLNKVGKAVGGLIKAALFLPKTAISVPAKAIGNLGDAIRERQIKMGTASPYMTAAERVQFRKENKYNKKGNVKFSWRADRFDQYDELLSGLNNDELEQLQSAMVFAQNSTTGAEKVRNKAVKDINDKLDAYGGAGYGPGEKITLELRAKLGKAINNGNLDEALSIIDSSSLNDASKENWKEFLTKKLGIINDADNAKANREQVAKSAYEQISKLTGVKNIGRKDLENMLSSVTDERKNRDDEDFQHTQEEMQRKKEEERYNSFLNIFKEMNDNLKNIEQGIVASVAPDSDQKKDLLKRTKNKPAKKPTTETVPDSSGRLIKYNIKSDGSKYIDTTDSETKEVLDQQKEEKSVSKGILAKLSNLNGGFSKFFGLFGKKEDTEEKKEGFLSKLKDFLTGGGALSTAAKVGLGLTGVGLVANLLDKEITITSEDGTETTTTVGDFIGDKFNIALWGENYKEGDRSGGLAGWFTNTAIPEIGKLLSENILPLAVNGMEFIFAKILPKAVELFISNLPNTIVHGVTGLGTALCNAVEALRSKFTGDNGDYSDPETVKSTIKSSETNTDFNTKISPGQTFKSGDYITTYHLSGNWDSADNVTFDSPTVTNTPDNTPKPQSPTNTILNSDTPSGNAVTNSIELSNPGNDYAATAGQDVVNIAALKNTNYPTAKKVEPIIKENYNTPIETTNGTITLGELLNSDMIVGVTQDSNGNDIPVPGNQLLNHPSLAKEYGLDIGLTEKERTEETKRQGLDRSYRFNPMYRIAHAAKNAFITGNSSFVGGKRWNKFYNLIKNAKGLKKVVTTPIQATMWTANKAVNAASGLSSKMYNSMDKISKSVLDSTNNDFVDSFDSFVDNVGKEAAESATSPKTGKVTNFIKSAGAWIGGKVKSVASKVASVADDAVKLLLSKLPDGLKNFLNNNIIVNYIKSAVNKVSGSNKFTKKAWSEAVEKITKGLVGWLEKKGFKELSECIAKKGIGTILKGFFSIALAIVYFVDGYRNANSIAGTTEQPSLIIRCACGITNAFNELFLLGLFPVESVFEFIYGILKNIPGVDNTSIVKDLEAQRKSGAEEVNEFNRSSEGGTNLTLEEYNHRNDKGLWSKIKSWYTASTESLGLFSGGTAVTHNYTVNKIIKNSAISNQVASGNGMIDEENQNLIANNYNELNEYVPSAVDTMNSNLSASFGLFETDKNGDIIGTKDFVSVAKQTKSQEQKDLQKTKSMKFANMSNSMWDILTSKLKNLSKQVQKNATKVTNLVDRNLAASLGFGSNTLFTKIAASSASAVVSGVNPAVSVFSTVANQILQNSKNLSTTTADYDDISGGYSGIKSYNYAGMGSKVKDQGVVTLGDKLSSEGSFISQRSPKYANKRFATTGDDATSTVAKAGCAPAVAAMAINASASSKTPMTLDTALRSAVKYKLPGGGVTADYFADQFESKGFGAAYISNQSNNMANSVKTMLSSNKPVVLMGKDPTNTTKRKSPFGPNSHYILATGLSKDGKTIYVNDPEATKANIPYDAKTVLSHSNIGVAPIDKKYNPKNISKSALNYYKQYTGSAYTLTGYNGKYGADSVEYYVWCVTRSAGYSEAATAGVMGNIYYECGFDPSLVEVTTSTLKGYGLFQFTGANRDYLEEWGARNGKDVGTKEAQMEYFLGSIDPASKSSSDPTLKKNATWYCSCSYKGYDRSSWMNAATPEEAARAFMYWYERPAADSSAKRGTKAREYYNAFTGSSVSGDGTIVASSGTPGVIGADSSSGTWKLPKVVTDLYTIFDDLAAAYGLSTGTEDTTSAGYLSNGSVSVAGSDGISGNVSANPEHAAKQVELVKEMRRLENSMDYSQSKRYEIYPGGYSDCSSLTQYLYKKVLGIDPGITCTPQYWGDKTYTVDMKSGGVDHANESNLQLGDLVFFGDTDHVEMYTGDNELMGHGSGMGPSRKDLSNYKHSKGYFASARYIGFKGDKTTRLSQQSSTTGSSGSESWGWPLPAKYKTVSSKFGQRNCPFHGPEFHNGVDLPAPEGTEIYASKSGVVKSSEKSSSYGNNVWIDHGKNNMSRYNHMSKRLVSKGQTVRKGDVIGLVGSTGDSTGNHLDFRIKIDDQYVDPMKYAGKGSGLLPLSMYSGSGSGLLSNPTKYKKGSVLTGLGKKIETINKSKPAKVTSVSLNPSAFSGSGSLLTTPTISATTTKQTPVMSRTVTTPSTTTITKVTNNNTQNTIASTNSDLMKLLLELVSKVVDNTASIKDIASLLVKFVNTSSGSTNQQARTSAMLVTSLSQTAQSTKDEELMKLIKSVEAVAKQ